MQISHLFHRWLVVLVPACSTGAIDPEPDPDTTGSTSTGETPPTPTSDAPTEPGSTSTTSPESTSTGTLDNTSLVDPGPPCGDGIQGPGEGCDAGDANDDYGKCTTTCQLNVCGDGHVLLGTEACDEGSNNVDTGYCRTNCELGTCGDGFLLAGLEECDAGPGSEAYGECDASCEINRCGDGQLDPGFEECDAGINNGSGGELGNVGCDLDCGFAGRRLFLSSQIFDGDLGTRAGADLACQNMAAAAKLPHPDRFRALLADAEVGPADFVEDDPDGRPFILPSGLVLANSYADLIKNGPGDGVTMTETGQPLNKLRVWTNLNVAGTAYLKNVSSTCASWSSNDNAESARNGLNAPAPNDAAALAEWRAAKHWLSFTDLNC